MHARPDLVNRLMAGRGRRLTVLDAPAGFGKTTLLAQWRSQLLAERVRVAWLTLDADDSAERLVAYVAFALQEAGVDMSATGILAPHGAGAPTGAAALDAVLNAVAVFGHHICLIFDDAERIAGADSLRHLDNVIRYAPENLHIAIAMRANPGLSLAELSVGGLVDRFDAEKLRFTPAEMSAYLADTVPAEDVRIVMERAEGWPAAMQILRMLALRGFAGSAEQEALPSGLAASYFAEELVRGLAPRHRDFLCDVSLLDEISIDLADRARAASDSAHLLRELDDLSALIPPLEGEEGHFRLHSMLREHFRNLAQADRERSAAIHRRTAEWFAARDKLPAALRHAVSAGDKMLAGALIVAAGGVSIWIRHGMEEVVAANALIDDEMIAAYPRLGLMRCIVLIKQSRMREAQALYERVAAATGDLGRDDAPDASAPLQREGLFIQSMLALYGCLPLGAGHLLKLDKGMHDPAAGDVELAHHKTVLCVTYLQNARFDLAWRYGEEAAAHCLACGSVFGSNFIEFHAGSIAMARGDTQEAMQRYEKGRRKSRRHFPHDVGLRTVGDVLSAEIDIERNAIANVKHRLARIVDRLHDAEAWFDIYAAAYGATAEIYLSERGLDETLAFLDQAQARAEHLGLVRLGPLLESLRVTTLTLAGESDRALRIAERSATHFSGAGLDDASAPWREVESLSTAWVRLMLRKGRVEEALRAADAALAYARDRGVARMALRLNVLAARGAEMAGDRIGALARIGEVCGEVARTGYLRAVLREGPGLLPLLREAGQVLPSDVLRQQARDLADVLAGQEAAALRTPVFSPRELDVLKHLNQGLQDKMIARRLGVTEHAVRFHLKNIYAKTRARGRLEAVVRARELGLFEATTYQFR